MTRRSRTVTKIFKNMYLSGRTAVQFQFQSGTLVEETDHRMPLPRPPPSPLATPRIYFAFPSCREGLLPLTLGCLRPRLNSPYSVFRTKTNPFLFSFLSFFFFYVINRLPFPKKKKWFIHYPNGFSSIQERKEKKLEGRKRGRVYERRVSNMKGILVFV